MTLVCLQVSTVVDSETDTLSTRFTASAAAGGLTVQLAFCNLASGGEACNWVPGGSIEEHYTTVVSNTVDADGKTGRLDLFRRLASRFLSVMCFRGFV
jgi:hypothetical protein